MFSRIPVVIWCSLKLFVNAQEENVNQVCLPPVFPGCAGLDGELSSSTFGTKEVKFLQYISQIAGAIDCNFTFDENDSIGSTSEVAQTQIANLDDSQNQIFNCNQSLDEGLTFVNESTLGNRFNSQESYELQEPSCITSRRFITPRALNNVYNQFIVLNSATYVQKIQITECRYS